jgi:hypothetical protein
MLLNKNTSGGCKGKASDYLKKKKKEREILKI